MTTRFIQIFWGLLLALVDFKINQIDVLPDFLGYILVALGCRGLAEASPRFATASNLAWVMTVLALAGYAIPRDTTGFAIVGSVMDCAMIWFLLGGVMELADFRRRPDLAQRASSRRIAYVTIGGLTTLLSLMGPRSLRGAEPLVVMIVIGMLVVLCLILHLIHRSIRELSEGPRW